MDVFESPIPGCFELRLVFREDIRARYVKVPLAEDFARHGIATAFAATYHHRAARGTLRGLHAARPPLAQDALVYCIEGEVFDAVLDLRAGSPAFRRFATFRLSAERANMLYVPKGVAHGFCVLTERATVVYQVTTPHAPEQDGGVLWSSAGIPWPEREPLLAETDLILPELVHFESPFIYAP